MSSAGAAADAEAGTAFGRDFNKTSAVWTVDRCCAGSCGLAVAGGRFWRVVPRRLGKGARSHRFDIDVILCVRLLSFNVFFGE